LGVLPGKESPEINVSRKQRKKWVLEKIMVAPFKAAKNEALSSRLPLTISAHFPDKA
jgi:hypothetical protein